MISDLSTIKPSSLQSTITVEDTTIQNDKNLLTKASKLKIDSKTVTKYITAVSQSYDAIHDIVSLSNPLILADIGLSFPQASIQNIVQEGSKVYVLNTNDKQILSMDSNTTGNVTDLSRCIQRIISSHCFYFYSK